LKKYYKFSSTVHNLFVGSAVSKSVEQYTWYAQANLSFGTPNYSNYSTISFIPVGNQLEDSGSKCITWF